MHHREEPSFASLRHRSSADERSYNERSYSCSGLQAHVTMLAGELRVCMVALTGMPVGTHSSLSLTDGFIQLRAPLPEASNADGDIMQRSTSPRAT